MTTEAAAEAARASRSAPVRASWPLAAVRAAVPAPPGPGVTTRTGGTGAQAPLAVESSMAVEQPEATEPRRATASPEATLWSSARPRPEATDSLMARELPDATEVLSL